MVMMGCASSTMTVNSVPEKAKVFVRPVGGGELVEVGITPAVISEEKLRSAGGESGPVFVEVQKEQFQPQRVLVTETAATDMKLDFALQLADENTGLQGPGRGIEDAQSLNMAIDRLFEVRKFISLESYDQALNHLKVLEQKWPYISAAYEMKGGILFLKKKYRDALAAYSMSLKYNPNSVPSKQMRDSLETQLGIDGDQLIKEYELNRIPANLKIDPKAKVKGKKRKSKKKRKKRKRRKKR
jgi:tetratricopeptide (TPR) repeat protein